MARKIKMNPQGRMNEIPVQNHALFIKRSCIFCAVS